MPECSVHLKLQHLLFNENDPIPKAIAQVKRVYPDGQFNVMLTCEPCLSEIRRMAATCRFEDVIHVEMFNRRHTDELRRDGVLP
jgi:hypothetical protein